MLTSALVQSRLFPEAPNPTPSGSRSNLIWGSFLIRLSKHLALLLLLMIVGRASWQAAPSQASLLALAGVSVLLHLLGRTLQRSVWKIAVVRRDPRAPQA
jgi:hypothetical protein